MEEFAVEKFANDIPEKFQQFVAKFQVSRKST